MKNEKKTKAVCLHSGGLDSTAALLWAIETYDEVVPLFVDYGQDARDVAMAGEQLSQLGLMGKHRYIKTDIFARSGLYSSMTMAGMKGDEVDSEGFVNAFLPNRNLVLLTIGFNLCITEGADYLVVGVVAEGGVTEFENAVMQNLAEIVEPNFPDSTVEYMVMAEELLKKGTGREIEIVMPFCALTKLEMLDEFDDEQADFLTLTTSSCNERDYERGTHEWGLGCGQCAKCVARQKIIAVDKTRRRP